MKGWIELLVIVIAIVLLCRFTFTLERPGAQSGVESLEPTYHSYKSNPPPESNPAPEEPKYLLSDSCARCGSHRVKLQEDGTILIICGWPSDMGDHPNSITGLDLTCLDCKYRWIIRGSHWHPSHGPLAKKFRCHQCPKANEVLAKLRANGRI